MTASALNTASIAPAAQSGAGASANAAGAGPAAGFEALLDALFPQADPTAAPPTGAQPAAPAIPGAPVKGDALLEGADELADADADTAVETPGAEATTASDAEAGLAVCLMGAQPPVAEPPITTGKDASANTPHAFGRDKAKGSPAAPALLHANPHARLAEKAGLAPETADAATPVAEAEVPGAPDAAVAPQARNTAPASAAPTAQAPTAQAPVGQAPATTLPATSAPDVQPDLASASVVGAPVEAPPVETAAVAAGLTPRPDAVPAPAANGRPAKAERIKAANDPSAATTDGPKAADAAAKPTQAKAVQATAQGAAKDASATVEAAETTPEDTTTPSESLDAAIPAETRAASQSASPSHSTHGVRGGPETVASLAAQMVKKLGDKTSHFDVQLDPHGLGKVDVHIEINAQGRISAGMTFDNPQAAADVKARAAELQRALEQAGFDLSGGISFDVAQDRGQQQQNQAWQDQGDAGRAFQGRAFRAALETAGDAADAANQGALRLRRGVNSGLDLRI